MTNQSADLKGEIELFLAACSASSAAAYEQFKEMLRLLEDPASRVTARRLLSSLLAAVAERSFEECLAAFHFGFQQLPAGREGHGGPPLTLLHFPSVFAPEEWSRTFFEGLARLPAGEIEGRTVAELGSGSGWLSLALARRALPAKVYGLDLNPKSVTCARINLYLNALDDDGAPLLDSGGKTLLDRVEFHLSDLLAWVRERGLELDRIFGCIPQVLDPALPAAGTAMLDSASDELLYSLSNYTSRQGYLEDQFGLGLIARALEESIEVLRPSGRFVFNLGGRPGQTILRHLFRRRGCTVREVWKTRIRQAADTDIGPLVEIERGSPHRFEFYIDPHSDEPISARTAQAYQQAGGAIYHSLTVVEGSLRHPDALQGLYRTLSRPEYSQVRSALDLAFDDEPVAEEKTAVLARLAQLMTQRSGFPYESTAGSRSLRSRFAEFLRSYFGISWADDCFVVTPNRQTAVRNVFHLYAPARSLVEPGLLAAASAGMGEALECPLRVDLACKLIEALHPQVVVTTLADYESRTPDSFLRLVETTGRAGARLVVDISPYLDLESTPAVNGVLQALALAPLPEHVAILCGLVKNRVYRDLEVCFVISENRDLLAALSGAAEVTYSRTPLLHQDYYETILTELLSFRLDVSPAESVFRRPKPESGGDEVRWPPLAERCRQAFRHPALAAEQLPISSQTIRLDYGENALRSPAFVKASLLEAFARRGIAPAELDVVPEIAAFLRRRFGWSSSPGGMAEGRFAFGLGVAPLFAALAEMCAAEDGTFLFPGGAYGHFVATVEFFGGHWDRVATRRDQEFKIAPEALDEALARVRRPWLYLNGPVVNPTGSLYTAGEIAELLAVASRHRARVVLDVLFSGLELENLEPWDLDTALHDQPTDLVLLGGISKELAAGGLRFGFACCRSDATAEALARRLGAAPHSTMLYAARKAYASLNRLTPESRSELEHQRATLRRHAELLGAALTETGWEPLLPRGGLFLVARPAAYLGRRVRIGTPRGEKEYVLDSENLPEALFFATGLLINNSVWTGLPEHCRFVYSVPEEQLAEGIRRLRVFRDLILGP
jgi:methionine S-methyltransferase